MANQLEMAKVNVVLKLRQRGWSFRKIAREVGVHRETVARYVRRQRPDAAKAAKAPTGSDGSKPAKAPTGSERSQSACEPYRELILAKLDLGLSAKRIHQDLVTEEHFAAGYTSVRRFVRRLRQGCPLPFRRLETPPGEEAQVDFGTAAPVIQPTGRRKRPWLFRVVLSYSRKAYSGAEDAGHRQPAGGSEEGRLVRARVEPEGRVVLRPLRHGHPADQGANTPAQGESGKGR